MDFLAFSEPSSQNQWENDWADMNFKKIAIWTTLGSILTKNQDEDLTHKCKNKQLETFMKV